MIQVNIATVSYSAGAALFLLLTLLLLTAWRGRLQGGLLVMATAVTTVWCGSVVVFTLHRVPPFSALQFIEVLRDAAWFLFLLRLLGYALKDRHAGGRSLHVTAVLAIALCAAQVVLILANRYAGLQVVQGSMAKLAIFGHLLIAVAGLVLVEQVYRNTRPEHRWAIKFLCFGVGGFFAYDLFLYSHALLFQSVDVNLWVARGVVQAIVVPLIAVSAVRNPQWSLDIFVSRHIVFHSATFLGAGMYLMLMAGAGYYIRLYGGTWGGVAQVVFLFGAVVLLFMLMLSGQLRSRLRVFVSKHFFSNQYDYREEWLGFTRTLSAGASDLDLRANVIRAIAGIVESPGGLMWERQESGHFRVVSGWNSDAPPASTLGPDAPLVRFLRERGWVIFVDEYNRTPEHYDSLELPEWLRRMRRAWIVAPLVHGEELVAFLVLSRSSTKTGLNWEDSDLLKTVGRQAGGYLALWMATQALAEARQFEAFNRLSAYVVHDLKNMVAQLSLVVSNAKKHMHSPGFIEDAIDTVDNAANKMNRLLGQLRKGRVELGDTRTVDLAEVLEAVVEARSGSRPVPRLGRAETGVRVVAEPVRLAAVIEHLVQNAQDATPAEGEVALDLASDGSWARIEVRDNGCGMDAQFVTDRLFRPFDTTKGNAGMGVGVYESREFVTSAGGRIDVESEPGAGTKFTITLPLASGGGPEKADQHMELAS